jgi:hypothetical protein
MVDWMIEVLASYKCTEQTFFLAVRILDLYLARTERFTDIDNFIESMKSEICTLQE